MSDSDPSRRSAVLDLLAGRGDFAALTDAERQEQVSRLTDRELACVMDSDQHGAAMTELFRRLDLLEQIRQSVQRTRDLCELALLSLPPHEAIHVPVA